MLTAVARNSEHGQEYLVDMCDIDEHEKARKASRGEYINGPKVKT